MDTEMKHKLELSDKYFKTAIKNASTSNYKYVQIKAESLRREVEL